MIHLCITDFFLSAKFQSSFNCPCIGLSLIFLLDAISASHANQHMLITAQLNSTTDIITDHNSL